MLIANDMHHFWSFVFDQFNVGTKIYPNRLSDFRHIQLNMRPELYLHAARWLGKKTPLAVCLVQLWRLFILQAVFPMSSMKWSLS